MLTQQVAHILAHEVRIGWVDRNTAQDWLTKAMAEDATGHGWQIVTMCSQCSGATIGRAFRRAANDLMTARTEADTRYRRMTDAEFLAALDRLAAGHLDNSPVALAAD